MIDAEPRRAAAVRLRMPLQLLTRWIFGLLSLAVLISAGWLLYDWWRYEQDSDDWRLWTGLGLLAFSFLGRLLVLLLIGKGGRPPVVAAHVDKSVEALMLYLATLRAGYVFLPLNTGYTLAEIEYFLSDAEPGSRSWTSS